MNDTSTKAFVLKMQRTATAFLPADEERKGSCLRCGQCCRFALECPFFDGEGCAIYPVRPPQCRKYPRTGDESIVSECGFTFSD